MKIIKGDLIDLAERGMFDIIVHGCNCFNTMGSGIARQLKTRYPQVYIADLKTEKGSIEKLGTFSFSECGGLTVINAYTQHTYNLPKEGRDLFNYSAFMKVLYKLAQTYDKPNRFGFPMIGCGLAGGDPVRVMKILNMFDNLVAKHGSTVTIVQYEGSK